MAACERAIEEDPTSADCYSGKGDALCGLKRYEEALAAFERAIDIDSDHAAPYAKKSHFLGGAAAAAAGAGGV